MSPPPELRQFQENCWSDEMKPSFSEWAWLIWILPENLIQNFMPFLSGRPEFQWNNIHSQGNKNEHNFRLSVNIFNSKMSSFGAKLYLISCISMSSRKLRIFEYYWKSWKFQWNIREVESFHKLCWSTVHDMKSFAWLLWWKKTHRNNCRCGFDRKIVKN